MRSSIKTNTKRKTPAKRKTPTKRKTPAKRKTPTKRKTSVKRKTPAKRKTPTKRKTSVKRKTPAKRKTPTKRKANIKQKGGKSNILADKIITLAIENKKENEEQIIKLCDEFFKEESQYAKMKKEKPKYETLNLCKTSALLQLKKKSLDKEPTVIKSVLPPLKKKKKKGLFAGLFNSIF